MINLPKRKSTFNFFEAFSDLVFCTLVMFLVLILFLAMNVNQKAVAVEEDQEQVTAEIAAIQDRREQAEAELSLTLEDAGAKRRLAEEERLRAERERAEAERQRARAQQRAEAEAERARQAAAQRQAMERALVERQAEMERQLLERQAEIERILTERQAIMDQMQQAVELERLRYEEALGTRRFEGLPPRPRLIVAYQWEERSISVHLVPADFLGELNTAPPGLTGQALAEHYTRLRARFLQLSRQVEPLSAAQYRALIRSISVGVEPVPLPSQASDSDTGLPRGSLDIEFAVDRDGKPTTAVAVVVPGGNAAAAGVRVGDVLVGVGDEGVTVENLGSLIAGYRVGDTARLLLRRGGKPEVVRLDFRPVQVVEVGEAYRTDLSMVVSGALDASYNYLWAPAQADALRERLQQGRAGPTVWQDHSRWEDRVSVPGRPVLTFDVDPRREVVFIGGERFSPAQFRRVLESLAGGGLVIEYAGKFGPDTPPPWLIDTAMRPTGFVNRSPNLELLEEDK
ncbi:MAG: PDZ domain-containing protein [Planctomycetota bacterium]